jgi:hypothetical protein
MAVHQKLQYAAHDGGRLSFRELAILRGHEVSQITSAAELLYDIHMLFVLQEVGRAVGGVQGSGHTCARMLLCRMPIDDRSMCQAQ